MSVQNRFKAKENQHFKKIEALNQAAKDLQTGNFSAFEEFTSYEDSDYESSECEEEPPHPQEGPSPDAGPDGKPKEKPAPKPDKKHDVKPKESFYLKLKNFIQSSRFIFNLKL